MKHLLITGGCGFIGTNFIRFLLSEKTFTGRIINLDALTYAGNLENLDGIAEQFPERYIFVQADICDAHAMASIFDRYGIDSVCHFAAESHVDRSIVKPDAFIRTNIIGTFNLLEQAKIHQHGRVLFIMSVPTRFSVPWGATASSPNQPPMTPAAPIQRPKPRQTIWFAHITGHTGYPLPFQTVQITTAPISFRKN